MKKTQRGFSLTELILYLAIIGILMTVVVSMFLSFSKTQTKAESQTELQQNARAAVERIRQEIVKAASVNTPTAGVANAGNNLSLVMSSTWTCFQAANVGGVNILQMSEGGSGACGGTWNSITSSKVSITNADVFTRYDNTNAKSTIQFKLNMNYNGRTEYTHSTQTTVGLR